MVGSDGENLLKGLDVLAEGVGIGYAEAHVGDGAGRAVLHDGVGVFHEVSEDFEAAEHAALEFLTCEFNGLGGEALELTFEVFVLQPAVEGGVAYAGVAGGLAHVGCGGEDRERDDLSRGELGRLRSCPILYESVPLDGGEGVVVSSVA